MSKLLPELVALSSRLHLWKGIRSQIKPVVPVDIEDDGSWSIPLDAKKKPIGEDVPIANTLRTSNYESLPFADAPKYLFPFGHPNERKIRSAIKSTLDRFGSLLPPDALAAVEAFYAKQGKKDLTRYNKLFKTPKDTPSWFGFRYKGKLLVTYEEVLKLWTHETIEANKLLPHGNCTITGRYGPIPEVHDRLRGDKLSRSTFNQTAWTPGRGEGAVVNGVKCKSSQHGGMVWETACELMTAERYLEENCARLGELECAFWTEDGYDSLAEAVRDLCRYNWLDWDELESVINVDRQVHVVLSEPATGRLVTWFYGKFSARDLWRQIVAVFGDRRQLATFADLAGGYGNFNQTYFVELWRAVTELRLPGMVSQKQVEDCLVNRVKIDFKLTKSEVRDQMDQVAVISYRVGRARWLAQQLQTMLNGIQRTNNVRTTPVTESEIDRWIQIADLVAVKARHEPANYPYARSLIAEFRRIMGLDDAPFYPGPVEVHTATVLCGEAHMERWWYMKTDKPKPIAKSEVA